MPLSSKLVKSYCLAEKSPYHSASPDFFNRPSEYFSGEYPELNAYLLSNVKASVYSSHIVCKNEILISDERYFNRLSIPSNGGRLCNYDKETASIRPGFEVALNKGIFIGGDGSFNWYHFVIECLPKAYLARKLPSRFHNYPLLLPRECEKNQSFLDFLKLVAGARKFIFFSNRDRIFVRRLIFINDVSYGPFNFYSGIWPKLSDYKQHDFLLKEFINYIHGKLFNSKISSNRTRIFLARSGNRRNYNQNQLIEISEKYDFTTVYPENLSFFEQANLFYNARFIIGPSGAAWANIIFSKKFTGLSWLPKEYEDFSSYSTLAGLLGNKIKFLSPITAPLASTNDAYVANYLLDTVDFESAIEQMLLIEN